MKSFAAVAALAAGAHALALDARGGSCCFGITASGGTSGTVGQLSDGQNRIGGGLPPGKYCLGTGGVITDGNGRGCILTPPTTQWQCDTGASGTAGFSISSSGAVQYNGGTTFVACQTGDNGEYNIYTSPPSGSVSGCVQVTLEADSCKPSSSAPPPPPKTSVVVVTVTETVCAPSSSIVQPTSPSTSSPAPPPPATSTSASASPTQTSGTPTVTATTCPTTLSSGSYEYPHLIIPINSASPSTALGNSLNGEVTSTISSIFNFDIPSADSGKTCSLVFLFPEQSQLETSSFTFSGDGKVDILELMSPATSATTYANAPAVKQDYGDFTFAPGNSYTISTFSCPAGDRIAFEIKNAGSTNLTYFQDYNPSPIGLYITTC